MGDTISSLVFRPPPPTPIHPSDFFYLDVDVHSPLCTNKSSYRRSAAGDGTGSVRNGGGGNTRSSDSHERNRFVGGTSTGGGGGVCGHFDDDDMIASHSSGSGCFGGAICLDPTSESDLASLDASYLKKDHNRGSSRGRCSPSSIDFDNQNNSHHTNDHDNNVDNDAVSIPKNIRNGQVYKIPAFFIRRRNATQTLLFSHGNAEDLGMMYPRMKDLALVLGVNVLAYEYTGYGLSVPGPTTADGNENWNHTSGEGKLGGGRKSRSDSSISGSSNEGPSENMIYRNIEAAYRYLTHDRKIPPQQIILYGRSVGSGPSCYLAAKTALSGNSVGGLVLHSPFLSVYKVVADLNGLDMRFAGDLFQNERRARNIRCPTFIIHGREDEVVPFWHAPRLLGIIPPEFRAQPFYVDGMGHNHIESQCRDRYISEMTNFLIMGVQNGCRKSDGDHHLMRSSARLNLNGLEAIETKENHPSFYINKTWLRHAQVLLKEVFFSDLGGMCHIHQSSVSNGDNDSKWKGGSTSRSSGSRSSHLSDVRDEDNEFSPWTGGVGSKHPPQSPRNVQTQQHQQQRQVRMQSGKILTPRSIGTSNNNNPVSVASRGSPRYHQKSQPMKSNLDVSGRQHHRQQTRRFSTSDMKISSPRAQHHASSKQRVTLSKEVSNQRRSHC